MRLFVVSVGFIFIFHAANAQTIIRQNQQLLDSIELCVDLIYDYQFDKAASLIGYIEEKTPGHPLSPFLYGMFYYWRDYPLTPESDLATAFVDSIKSCLETAKLILEKDRENAEANFLTLTSRALLMEYYADNKQYWKAFEHIYPGYKIVMKGFELRNELDEFNYYTGLFNYYREEYPRVHTMYKPLVYFLKRGDPEAGIQQLYYASQNCIFMDTEAYLFLVIIYLHFKNDPPTALQYMKKLYQLKSNNRFFLSRLIELKLINKDSVNLEQLLDKLFDSSVNDRFTLMLAYIYKGWFEEQYNQNYTIAQYDYKKGLKMANDYEAFADNYKAYAYLGLYRIYQLKEKPVWAEKYLQMAKELAPYAYYFNDMPPGISD